MNKYPTPKNVIGIFVYLLAISLVIGIPLRLINKHTIQFDEAFIELFSYLVSSAIVAVHYLKKKKQINQENYYLRKESVSISFWALILGVMTLMIIIVTPLLNLIPVPDWFLKIMKEVISDDRYSFLSVVIVAPIFEELIMRGVILDGFLKRYNPQKAILYSSIIFGLIHLNPWQFIDAFIGGLYIGWIYYRTRSIIPCIAIHVFNNLVAFSMFLLPEENILMNNPVVENKFLYILFILLTGVLFYFGIRRLDNKLEIKPAETDDKQLIVCVSLNQEVDASRSK